MNREQFNPGPLRGKTYTKVTETGNLDKIQDVYTPDRNYHKDKREEKIEAIRKNMFKSSEQNEKDKLENIVAQLYTLQTELAELRKSRGDKAQIKELEAQINELRKDPAYKNTLNYSTLGIKGFCGLLYIKEVILLEG